MLFFLSFFVSIYKKQRSWSLDAYINFLSLRRSSLQLFDLLVKIALQESEAKDDFEIVSSSDLAFDYSSSINSRFHLQNLLKYAISQISSLLIRLPSLRQCLPSRILLGLSSNRKSSKGLYLWCWYWQWSHMGSMRCSLLWLHCAYWTSVQA